MRLMAQGHVTRENREGGERFPQWLRSRKLLELSIAALRNSW